MGEHNRVVDEFVRRIVEVRRRLDVARNFKWCGRLKTAK
jgi:hypothetical protein